VTPARLWRTRRASTTVEFAVIGVCLCMVTFGIVEAGILWWLKTGLEVVAADTARCRALGSYPTTNSVCTSDSAAQTYATNSMVQNWWLPIQASSAVVNVSHGSTCANGASGTSPQGNFYQISITVSLSTALPPPFQNFTTMGAIGCYPVP
jgi:Flp pilus assembly protein TadG